MIVAARAFNVLVLGSLLLSCASAGGVRTRAPTPSQSLRRQLDVPRAVFARTQSVRVLGDGFSFQLDAPSEITVHAFSEDELLVLETFGAPVYQQDGEIGPVPEVARWLDGLQLRMRVDARNQIIELPQLTGGSPVGPVLQSALFALSRALHITYPEAPVEVGERWTAPPIRLSTSAELPLDIEVELAFVLGAVERDEEGRAVAVIAWDGALRVLPFDAMGMSLEGGGRIVGVSRILIRDGTTGSTDLDIGVSVGPRSAAEVLRVLRATLKYRDEVRPRLGAPRTLIDGVRPIDPRAAGSE